MIFEHLHLNKNQKIDKGDYKVLTRWQDILNINHHNKKVFKNKLNLKEKIFYQNLV